MESKNKLFSFFKKLGNNTQREEPPELPSFHDEPSAQTKPRFLDNSPNIKHESKAKPLAKGISLLVGIYYANENNETEKRRITIRRLWQQDDNILIDAFCHETQAPRIFSLSRITKIVDLKTRKAFADAKAFILSQIAIPKAENPTKTSYASDNSTTLSAINKVRSELTSLIFLAQTDSDFSPVEKRVITDYIMKKNAGINLDINEINEYVSRIYPDEESFYDAIEDLLSKSEQTLTDFVETFIKLILADGIVHDNEREFLAELLLILKEEGIEIETKI